MWANFGQPVGHTEGMAGSRELYAERRPYVVARSLRELQGPTSGRVRLPLHLDWSKQGTCDLDDEATLRLMYERVLREAQSDDDLCRYLNGAALGLARSLPSSSGPPVMGAALRRAGMGSLALAWLSTLPRLGCNAG